MISTSAIVKTGILVNIAKQIGTIVGQILVTMEQPALIRSQISTVLVPQDLEVISFIIISINFETKSNISRYFQSFYKINGVISYKLKS